MSDDMNYPRDLAPSAGSADRIDTLQAIADANAGTATAALPQHMVIIAADALRAMLLKDRPHERSAVAYAQWEADCNKVAYGLATLNPNFSPETWLASFEQFLR